MNKYKYLENLYFLERLCRAKKETIKVLEEIIIEAVGKIGLKEIKRSCEIEMKVNTGKERW